MKKEKKLPVRRCVGCREMKDKTHIIRVVCNSNGNISIDITGKAHGRGAYICKNTDCWEKARKTKGLERSLKRAVPQEIYDTLKNEF